MKQRVKHPKDLGETMVIAHAVVAAEAGQTVTILIDDGPGAHTATAEISRLERLRACGRTVGSIKLVSTQTVLERADQSPEIFTLALTCVSPAQVEAVYRHDPAMWCGR